MRLLALFCGAGGDSVGYHRAGFDVLGVDIEPQNVEGSPLPYQSDLLGRHGVMLCGTSFGLRIRRHRLFEASFPIHGKPCRHNGVAMNPYNAESRDRMRAEFGDGPDMPEIVWRKEMGVEWMTRLEGREAIPPIFTEYLGAQVIAHIAQAVAA